MVGKVGQHPELAPQDAERLRVAEALNAARQPVLLHEPGELVNDLLRPALLLGQLSFLRERKPLVRTGGVQHRLSGSEQGWKQEPVELVAPQELGAPLQAPAPDRELADRLQCEVGESVHTGVYRSWLAAGCNMSGHCFKGCAQSRAARSWPFRSEFRRTVSVASASARVLEMAARSWAFLAGDRGVRVLSVAAGCPSRRHTPIGTLEPDRPGIVISAR